MDVSLVYGVVLVHLAVTLFPFLGAFLILRWRWFVWVHIPIAVWAFSIPFLHYPCPLTDLEKALRFRAGMSIYEADFISQYIYSPLAPYGHVVWDNFCWLSIAIAYWLYFRRPDRAQERAA